MASFLSRVNIKAIDIVKYLFFMGIVARAILNFSRSPDFWYVILLLAVFLVLAVALPFLHRRVSWSTHLVFLLLSGIIYVLALMPTHSNPPTVDYFSVLFILPIIHTGELKNHRLAIFWNLFFTLTMVVTMIVNYDGTVALQFIIIYAAVILFMASYVFVLKKAETSDQESRDLLSKLKIAHGKLQLYASQAKELAVAEERNRLARELHDSVTQTIFSMTLAADSAKILLEKDPGKVSDLLDRMQKLAQGALSEMRSLIAQLRPKTAIEGGLAEALRKHFSERQSQDGLIVEFDAAIDEEIELPEKLAENLFRITQEALNNISKHAQTDSATVILKVNKESALLQIEDNGVGFEPDGVPPNESHLGLIGMRERVRNIDATFTIDSKPGNGTKITVKKVF